MNPTNKKMRVWLENCTRKQFTSAVHELMLTNYEKKLLIMRKQKFSLTKIALKLHKDSSRITKELSNLYHRLFSVVE